MKQDIFNYIDTKVISSAFTLWGYTIIFDDIEGRIDITNLCLN